MLATPTNLRTEYKRGVAGIDSPQPRFSWFGIASPENANQEAFHLIVASSFAFLDAEKGDMWDSGWLTSGKSHGICYQGKQLESLCHYFWKVRIRTSAGTETLWSEPASFITGVLNNGHWPAKLITTVSTVVTPASLSFLDDIDRWIWYPFNVCDNKKCTVWFRKKIFISNQSDISSSKILITADEKFRLFINGVAVAQSDEAIFSWSRPFCEDISRYLVPGENIVAVEGTNSYVEQPGLICRIILNDGEGKEAYGTGADWKSSSSVQHGWPEKDFDDSSWRDSTVIANCGDGYRNTPHAGLQLQPAISFRKTFIPKSQVTCAVLCISALGLYQVRINGSAITNDLLTPGWSDYKKRVYYQLYDVTDFINAGTIQIEIIAADGWYAGYLGWEKNRGYYGTSPAITMILKLHFEDGSMQYISTDKSWAASESRFREADLLMGETLDACLSTHNPMPLEIAEIDDDGLQYTCYPGCQVNRKHCLEPVRIKETGDNKLIIDFGQNFAGFIHLKLKRKPETFVRIRHAEMLDANGGLYVGNIRMARAKDTFIPAEGRLEYEPQFTYHGFRYAEFDGVMADDIEEINGVSINSLGEQTIRFETSNEDLNRLQKCTLWNQRSNYVDIPTDCPQRDERFGWTGDAVSFFRTAAYQYDVAGFYTKWLIDLFDTQKPDGSIAPIAPIPNLSVGPLYFNAAGWADAAITVPYSLYLFYGDKSVLEKYYLQMKKYIQSLVDQAEDFTRGGMQYGDWLCSGKETSKEYIAQAYFCYTVRTIAKIAQILEERNDTRYYEYLHDKTKGRFRQKYISVEGKLLEETQTAQILALMFGLLTPEEAEIAKNFLINDIVSQNHHTSVGFLGLSFLMPVLQQLNRNDVALKLLFNEEFPSWIYMIRQGATTLWERWDSYTPEKGFYDPTMNSFNHCSLGCVGEWLYSGLAGLEPIEPGFASFRLRPHITPEITQLSFSFTSVNGEIALSWSLLNGVCCLNVKIPFNTTGELVIPARADDIIGSVGSPKNNTKSDFTTLTLSPGEYHWEFAL